MLLRRKVGVALVEVEWERCKAGWVRHSVSEGGWGYARKQRHTTNVGGSGPLRDYLMQDLTREYRLPAKEALGNAGVLLAVNECSDSRGDCFVATLVLPHNAPVLWAMPVGGLRPPARGLTVAAAENLASLPPKPHLGCLMQPTWLDSAHQASLNTVVVRGEDCYVFGAYSRPARADKW